MNTRWGLVVALCSLLASCAGPMLNSGQLNLLDKGIAPERVQQLVAQPPVDSRSTQSSGRTFRFDRYRLYNGLGTDWYWLAYEGGALTYWGYAADFKRHSDATLRRAAEIALSEHAPQAATPPATR